VTGEDEGDLFAAAFAPLSSAPAADLRVPAKFIPLVEQVERHRDPARFDLLYTVLWRLRHTPGLLDVASDPLVRRLENMARSVRRDRHKMTAFWPAAGLVDTEKRCFMKPEVGYGEASIQSGVQGRDGSSGSRRGVSVARPGRLVDEG
jgi:hypothetical protein